MEQTRFQGTNSQLPPQINTDTFRPVSCDLGIPKHLLDNKASHAVVAARGTVAAASGLILWGTGKEMALSTMVYCE